MIFIHDPTIYAFFIFFSYLFEKGEKSRNDCIYNRKRGSGHAKTHWKSITNQCKIDAGKRHAKSMDNYAKMKQTWIPKSIHKYKKHRKRHATNHAEIWCRSWGSIVWFWLPFGFTWVTLGVRGLAESGLFNLTTPWHQPVSADFGTAVGTKTAPKSHFWA